MRNSLKRWPILLFLSFIGMFLSEFLIWNVSMFAHVFNESPLRAAAMLVFGHAIYFIIFVFFVDFVHRFKVRDFIGLILLGSVYGLILEGIFADSVFDPNGTGPQFFGVYLMHLNFTALSWHPLIDFALGFLFFKFLLRGKFNLAQQSLTSKEAFIILCFSIFWFTWSYARWQAKTMPLGIPVGLQLLVLLYPMVLFAILLPVALRSKQVYSPGSILGNKTPILFALFIIYFAVVKFQNTANKAGFFFFCAVVCFYLLLFFSYIRFGLKKKSSFSIFEESFPVVEHFNRIKYMKICCLILLYYFSFQLIALHLSLAPLFTLLSIALFLYFNLFALFFPAFAILRIVGNLLSKER